MPGAPRRRQQQELRSHKLPSAAARPVQGQEEGEGRHLGPDGHPRTARKPLRFLKLEDEDDEELELRLSAAEGRADAQYNLGVMFDGQGATADPQEAARNY